MIALSAKDVARFLAKVRPGAGPDDCAEWTANRRPSGYGKFWFRGKDCSAHRVAYELAYTPIPDGLWVLHRCDNPPCVNPAHLFLGTHADNVRDRDTKGRQVTPRGEENGQAKLTAAIVREIRAAHSLGEVSYAELSRRYGVNRATAHCAITGRTWKHVGACRQPEYVVDDAFDLRGSVTHHREIQAPAVGGRPTRNALHDQKKLDQPAAKIQARHQLLGAVLTR